MRTRSYLTATLAAMALLTQPIAASAADALAKGASSGFPVPRFVSLSSGEVRVRMGPSFSHKVKWTFQKEGLPVEVVSEFGNWRRVRDAQGEDGWVHHSLLTGRRTALIAPWNEDGTVPLRVSAKSSARAAAYLEPLVLAKIDRCDGDWCAISGSGWRGHVPQATLWGVYPSEELD